MRNLIVCNMISMDGYYEGKDRDLGALFAHMHPDYANDDRFDHYNLERLRAADTLLFSGKPSFQGFRDYWHGRGERPDATNVRRAIAREIDPMKKAVISDSIEQEDLAPWDNAEIVRRKDARDYVAKLKQQPGKDILILAGRMLWNDLMEARLVDELHIAIFPLIGFEGTKLFDRQPGVSLKLLETRTWQNSGVVALRYSVS